MGKTRDQNRDITAAVLPLQGLSSSQARALGEFELQKEDAASITVCAGGCRNVSFGESDDQEGDREKRREKKLPDIRSHNDLNYR